MVKRQNDNQKTQIDKKTKKAGFALIECTALAWLSESLKDLCFSDTGARDAILKGNNCQVCPDLLLHTKWNGDDKYSYSSHVSYTGILKNSLSASHRLGKFRLRHNFKF